MTERVLVRQSRKVVMPVGVLSHVGSCERRSEVDLQIGEGQGGCSGPRSGEIA